MKGSFFPKLAWTGMKKNKRLYVPYLLSSIGSVAMFYIMQSLSYSPLLHEMRGGGNMEYILTLGKFVIAVFALIFLLYTSSFLIRRRNREFGLYNVLGMGKGGIYRIVTWETLIVALVSLVGGILLGGVFSKLAELCLLRIVGGEIDYKLRIVPEAIGVTLVIFTAIFVLLYLRSLWQIRRSKPLELLKSETVGEKPPKSSPVLAILGLLLLGGAYWLAISIHNPLKALTWFFVAVIMVIIGTYLLMIAGSVFLCRLLQRNKNYYYRKNHFVSVSSMVYRMKRNGAGLASICILSTMVLVMLTSTSSLYFGMNDTIENRYPRSNGITVYVEKMEQTTAENRAVVSERLQSKVEENGYSTDNLLEYAYFDTYGIQNGNSIELDPDTSLYDVSGMDKLRQIFFITAEDYNRISGSSVTLSEGEALLRTLNCSYKEKELQFGDKLSLRIVGQAPKELTEYLDLEEMVSSTFLMIVKSEQSILPLDYALTNGINALEKMIYVGFDVAENDERQIEAQELMQDEIVNIDELRQENGGFSYMTGCKANDRVNFAITYGGLFFLGIMLSILFVFAAVMIIYYKQISEGYEDQSRFEIMRKVGMTAKDIRASINSQVLTVFFAPLLLAGLHLACAFPMIWKILQMFGLRNLGTVILINLVAYALFSVCYIIIYKRTAKSYFKIVSSGDKE